MDWSDQLAAELSRRVRGRVAADPMSRALYSTDASIYRATPMAAVLPEDDDDVRAVAEFASSHRLPLLPRGGGTSLEGQTVNEAIVVDLSRRLDRILEVDAEQGWARVQPGVIQEGLRRHAGALGLEFGPDTATGNRATVGGMIGNNSAGSHSIVYGKTIDHVLEVRCLLADGTEVVFGEVDAETFQARQRRQGIEGRIYRTVAAVVERNRDEILRRYPDVMRHVCGYSLDYLASSRPFGGDRPLNMAHLIAGSEGTLATILEAKVRLVERPKATALGVAWFDDLVAAMEATREIVGTGPSAVELIDRMVLEQARSHPTLARLCGFVTGDPGAVIVTEYSGDAEAEVAARVDELSGLVDRQGLATGFHRALSPAAQEAVWRVRKAGLTLMMRLEGDAKPIAFVEDTAVAVEHLPEYVQRLRQVVEDHGTWAGFYGHASVGCLHFRPVIDCKDADDIRRLRGIAEAVRDLVMEYGGSLSGEHGDGRTRTEFLPGFYGERIHDAFRQIKTAFDPEGRLNPGNICDPLDAEAAATRRVERPTDAAPPAEHGPYVLDRDLRYGPDYSIRDPARYLDWSREGGMAQHVEMCNGNGFCRKLDSGTMCPSYMVTRDEEHSTRGRANALRAVLSGAVEAGALTSPRLYEVLDLCLECKGCKGECPSNVDMAKLKYEFLAQYYEAHGTPQRARLFGQIARTSRWASRLAPLSNWIGNSAPVRFLNEKLFGISSRRPLPPFQRGTFESWFRGRKDDEGGGSGVGPASGSKRATPGSPGSRGPVVLFHDTFMNHNYPEIGRAAVRVLERAGWDVVLVDRVCCGRPMLSNGLAEEAREHARVNVGKLAGYARRGVPIVGCEPSCLLMLREDYLDLLPDLDDAATVARQAFLFDEFLQKQAAATAEEGGEAGGNGAVAGGGTGGGADAAGGGETARARLPGLRFRETPRHLLVHGHCHQKAAVGVDPTVDVLRWVPGYRVEPLDSGCCGMAGSFGYKAEHYELSMEIGERVLFPAVRDDAEAGVVVSGISCRQQVLHGTGRRARHPAEWLADALD